MHRSKLPYFFLGLAAVIAVAAPQPVLAIRARQHIISHPAIDPVMPRAAIDRVIATAREFTGGRVIVVVGAGGDRDREKRPHMGRAASAAD